MSKIRSLAILSCVLAPTLLLGACNTANGFLEDIRYNDWFANTGGKSASSSENLLSDGCPQASIVPELGTYPDFVNDAKPTPSTLVSIARISNVQSKCVYNSQSVTVDIKLAFEGAGGPALNSGGNKPSFAYPFFVAVTGPGGNILAKEVFAANMDYAGGANQTYFESMRQIIPIPNKEAGAHFKVLAGFQLSDDQLAYNRAAIAAAEAARKQREKVEKARIEAIKENAKQSDTPEVVVVPDTMTPSDSTPPPVNEPVSLTPNR